MRTSLLAFFLLLFFVQGSIAQDVEISLSSKPQNHKSITITSGIEANLLQFAKVESWNISQKNVPRYSYFFNTGFDANFRITNHFRIFTGLNVKNVGFIVKPNDSVRQKHRMYTIGAPFGFKFYMANNKVVFKTGADVGIGFNYKWKSFVNDKKTKNHEWFSNRTALFFPSLFAGLSVHGVSVTANYYLNNFFNPLHPAVEKMDARLFTLGMGLNLNSNKMRKPKTK